MIEIESIWRKDLNVYKYIAYLFLFVLLIIGIFHICKSADDNSSYDSYRDTTHTLRNLRHYSNSLIPVGYHGKVGIVRNITVYGAIIFSEIDALYINSGSHPHSGSHSQMESKSKTSKKLELIKNLTSELPFELTYWPAVMTRPCPQNRHGHKTERGVALAHYQIWLDFIFFDHDVIENLEKKTFKGLYNSSSWTSTSATFTASENGSLYKNGIPFLEDDILVVFEEDAESVINFTNSTIIEELSAMTTDLLYLGWCEGRLARPVPLCSQAYALTRQGARKMVKYYEPCGAAIDEQMVKFCKNNWITFRTAHDYSYKKNYKAGYPRYGDKTFGIFHQNKLDIPSMNGHR